MRRSMLRIYHDKFRFNGKNTEQLLNYFTFGIHFITTNLGICMRRSMTYLLN